MNLTEFEKWMFRALMGSQLRRPERPRKSVVNPPGSASREVRAERAKQKAATNRKKAQRKAGRR
ncbi:hypothetical protein SEA_DANTE_50 [Mycobacterium phage Dante]|uniref:Uncharacterized protein n=1 Tax=Mycobacterium phage Dante TaxID=1698357 RepID=A0A0K1Y788_9CAUD|nr:hypothetical protein AVV07_gp050 [Mycobacterium phage Dante]AKY02961.1 hypothetical protein SEA_DANTE_50 [Mycobacterium phage Dante]